MLISNLIFLKQQAKGYYNQLFYFILVCDTAENLAHDLIIRNRDTRCQFLERWEASIHTISTSRWKLFPVFIACFNCYQKSHVIEKTIHVSKWNNTLMVILSGFIDSNFACIMRVSRLIWSHEPIVAALNHLPFDMTGVSAWKLKNPSVV